MKKLFILILAFSMVMGFSITSLAANYESYNYNGVSLEKIELPKDDYSKAFIMLNSSTNKYILYLHNNNLEISSISSTSNSATIRGIESGSYKIYTHSDNGWVEGKVMTFNSGMSTTISKPFWASYDVYNNDELFIEGDPNFLMAPPLQEIILQVMEEQMVVTVPEIHGAMIILVVCGVGCLALLVVLKLFGKRSLLFLRR